MSKIERFEDLEAWKAARDLSRAVYKVTKAEAACRDFGYIDQIWRASVSVMNNLSEGFERGSNRNFVKFVYIARGSAGEVRNMLYVGLDQGYLSKDQFEELHAASEKTSKLCYGLIRHLSKRLDWKSKASLWLFFFHTSTFTLPVA